MSAAAWIGMVLAGGAGATLRYVADLAVTARTSRALPWGIFVVNLTGAFALGLLAGSDAGSDALRVAGTGLLGAYTTFSTWMLQVRVLLRDGRRRLATTYLGASLVLGFLAMAAGRGLA
ncbi:MAG: crcB [Solirubrobacterales bacterium]|jgi:CrcB protein|nr:crcB [Solirubrobacterales bacterium]